jgi:hypothetical protein
MDEYPTESVMSESALYEDVVHSEDDQPTPNIVPDPTDSNVPRTPAMLKKLDSDLGNHWKEPVGKRFAPNTRNFYTISDIYTMNRVDNSVSLYELHEIYRVTMSTKQAVEERGSLAIAALVREIKQLDEKQSFLPRHYNELTTSEKKRIIPSHTLHEVKYDVTTGAYIKDKARCVGGGDRQDRSLYQDNWSPTVSQKSLFIGVGLAAKEKRFVAVMDVPTAYPNAKPDINNPREIMRLNAMEAGILVILHPEYEPYIMNDGKMIVEVGTALYGLIDSARLWYEHIKSTLIELGFVQNPYV